MPGPFDYFDPAALTPVQGAGGPVAVPSFLASRFQPAIPIPATPAQPPAPSQAPLPLSIGGIPQLPPAIASKLAIPQQTPTPAPGQPLNAQAASQLDRQNAMLAQRAADRAASAAPPDPFAEAQQIAERGIRTRQEAAVAQGNAAAAGADQTADAIAEGNRQADLAREAGAKQLERDQAEQARLRTDLEAAQKAYADHKVDQGRYWHDSSTGQKVMMGIGIALSAAGSVLKHEGGKNPALDMIMGAVQRDVAMQMADRDKLKDVIGQKSTALDRMITLTRDNQAAMDSAVAAALERVKGQTAEIAARTQSATAKANAMDLVGQLDGAIATAKDAAAQGAWQRRKDDQQLAIQRQNVAIAGGHLALANKQFEEGVRQYDTNRADAFYKEAMDAIQKSSALAAKLKNGDVDSQKAALEVAKLQQELGTKNLEQTVLAPPAAVKIKNDDGTVATTLKSVAVTDAEGRPLQIPKEEAAKIRAKIGGAIFYSNAADQLLAWRDAHGWESKTWNSEDRQTAKVLVDNLKVAAKNAMNLGALSESDLDLVTGAIGVDDPGSIRDPSAAILKGREMTWAGVNADLASHGGMPVSMPTPGTADAQNSEVQQLTSEAMDRRKAIDPGTILDAQRSVRDDGLGATPYGSPRMTTKSLIAIQKLVQQARDPRSPNNADAIAALRTLADDPDPGTQRLIRDQIDAYRIPVANPTWRDQKPAQGGPFGALRGDR